MDSNSDLQQTRQKLYNTMSLDGIADITAGLALLALGGQIFFDAPYFLFVIVLLGPLMVTVRKRIVYPRLGYCDVDSTSGDQRADPRMKQLIVGTLALGVAIGIVKALGGSLPAFIENNALVVVGLLVAVAVAAIGVHTGIRRLHLYAAALLALVGHGALREYPTADGMDLVRMALGAHVMLFGAFALLAGLLVLARFLKRFPVEEDAGDVD